MNPKKSWAAILDAKIKERLTPSESHKITPVEITPLPDPSLVIQDHTVFSILNPIMKG